MSEDENIHDLYENVPPCCEPEEEMVSEAERTDDDDDDDNNDDNDNDNDENDDDDDNSFYNESDKSQDHDYDGMCQKKLERLKSIREGVSTWQNVKERREFLRQLYPLLVDWRKRLPDLRDIFDRDEIDALILEDLKDKYPTRYNRGHPIVKFVIRTGYRDEPDLDVEGRPVWRRATPLHRASRCKYLKRKSVVSELFKIYDRFDVNYTEESTGLTHFHVACKFGLYGVVDRFLKLGQDPNCPARDESSSSSSSPLSSVVVDPPLHLALSKNNACNVVVLLLKAGADPNLPNAQGLTPLHVICQRGCVSDDYDLAKIFFRINDDKQQRVDIDARDKLGQTPLRLAKYNNSAKLVELLLRRGAGRRLSTN